MPPPKIQESSSSPAWIHAFLAMFTVALIPLTAAISYPAIVFNGPLLSYLPMGLSVGLLSAVTLGAMLASLSGFRGTVSYMQSAPTVMIAVVTGSMAHELLAQQRSDQLLPTALALISVASLVCGLGLLLLGKYRLGNLIRYVPVPVIAGFMSGTGWLLVKSAIGISAGVPVSLGEVNRLLAPDKAAQWGLALACGFALWLLERRRPRVFNAVAVLSGVGAGFWLTGWIFDLDRHTLQAQGWLFQGIGNQPLWTPAGHVQAMAEADWGLVLRAMPQLLAVAAINAISLLVSASAIEVATDKDLDLNHELRLTGMANLLTGLVGGLPGHHAPSASILTHRMGVPHRWTGWLAALVCLCVLMFANGLLDYLPRILSGTLLAWVGLTFLHTWLHQRKRLMSVTDAIVTLIVFFTAIFLGIMEALVAGTAAGVILFVVRYSSIAVARHVLSGAVSHSSIGRNDAQRACLVQHGDEILILQLHSFVFFGTANALVSLVDARLRRSDLATLHYLLVDLRLVNGIDSSAAAGFARLERKARQHGFTLVLTNMPAAIAPVLVTSLPVTDQSNCMRLFADLDHAHEWAENDLLDRHGVTRLDTAIDFEVLAQRIFGTINLELALRYLEPMNLEAGAILAKAGDTSTDIYFIERGRIEVLLMSPDAQDVRLGVMEAGTLIGEMAMYLGTPRTATLVALCPTRVQKLAAWQMEAMQRDNPLLAAALHRHIAAALAGKLVDLHRLVTALGT